MTSSDRSKCGKLAGLLLLVAAATIGGCKDKKPPAVKKRDPINVEVMTITPIPSKADTFDLHAKVEPNRVVQVAAEVDGRIEEVLCEEGASVNAGPDSKPIIRLNADLLSARLKAAKAQSDIDRLEYQRLAKYRASKTATESELERARETANASKAALDEAQAMLDRTQVFPPIDGVLNQRHVEKGDYVQPGKVIAEIVDSATVKIVAHVPERDIHFLNVGDPAQIRYEYQRQERTLDANITFISKLAHPRSLTTQIEVKIDNAEGEFFSGQIVKLRLKRREEKDVIMIPLDSVIPLPRDNGQLKYAAYVAEGNVARRCTGIRIDLAFIEKKNVRLIEGLQAGQKLIYKGHRYVGDKQEINITNPTSHPPTNSASRPAEGK